MKMIDSLKTYSLVVIAILCNVCSMAQGKYALLVGINDYGNPHRNYGRWNDIHGADDVRLLYPILQAQHFNIDTVTDRHATYAGITRSIESLIGRVGKGDIVYVHFSMHGQAFDDCLSAVKDEEDGWDESLIPFDAKMIYDDKYKGENHLLDDQLHGYVERLRTKVGTSGHVYVIIDACHAGEQYRGDEVVRGTFTPFTNRGRKFEPDRTKRKEYFRIKTAQGQSPVTYLEACQSFELNREIRDKTSRHKHGPLSLHIARVIKNNAITTNASWTEAVKNAIESDAAISNQHMMIERSY